MHRDKFGTFYSTICHVCKSARKGAPHSDTLKTCQGCRLISYCSVDHQQQHWPQHRHFCKAVTLLMRTFKVAHIYESAIDTSENWCDLRVKVKALCEVMLKRPLSICESEMLYFPLLCLVCHKYDPQNLEVCNRCQCVCYCSDKHMREDASYHSKSCSELKIGFDLDISSFHGTLPDINLGFGGRNYCNSADNFQTAFMEFAFQLNNLSNQLVKSIYFTILSCPLTFIHSVFIAGLHLSQKLIVHLVGSGNFEIQHLDMWDIVFHWLPTVKHLHLVLIGPDVFATSQFLMCSECKLAGYELTVEFCSGLLYHNYVASSEFTKPDVIIMFNCGLSEFIGGKDDTWLSSIPTIMTSNCPVIITSYTAKEAENDISRLMVSGKVKDVLVRCKKNTFSAKKPVRDWEKFSSHSDSLVFYHNAFISILVPKA